MQLLLPQDLVEAEPRLRAELSQHAPREWLGARLVGGHDVPVPVIERERWLSEHLKLRGRLAWDEWPASGPDLEEADPPLCYLAEALARTTAMVGSAPRALGSPPIRR